MWNLWQRGAVLQEINLEEPLLDPWQKSTHPAQIALQSYLSKLSQQIQPLSHLGFPLYMHMRVDQQYLRERKRGKGDLENYLSPVAKMLSKLMGLALVSGEFCEGSGSTITIGQAIPLSATEFATHWKHLTYIPNSGYAKRDYKQNLKDALVAVQPQIMTLNHLLLHLSVNCNSSKINWINLWKPTVDALGPIVGEVSPPRLRQPFNPRDDRITQVNLHLSSNPTVSNKVQIGLWWQEV